MATVSISDNAKAIGVLDEHLKYAEAAVKREMSAHLEQVERLSRAVKMRDQLQAMIKVLAGEIEEAAT